MLRLVRWIELLGALTELQGPRVRCVCKAESKMREKEKERRRGKERERREKEKLREIERARKGGTKMER